MPHQAPDDDIVAHAAALAREVAAEIDSILLTVYPDADTLDTLRPGGSGLPTVQAATRAVALEMAASGVQVLVQRADRAAFRRWLDTGEDTPGRRLGWVDRGGLLRGEAAWAALGLDMPAPQPAPRLAKAPGPPARDLLDAFEAPDAFTFDTLVQALLQAGRGDVLDLAVRKLASEQGDDAADALAVALTIAAEGGGVGPSGWAELVVLPVALPAGQPPDAVELAASVEASGLLEATEQVRFLQGWRAPEAVDELSPLATRRVLLDLVEGREPRDLPPGDTDDLARHGFGVLLGVRIDWDVPVWDAIEAAGGLPDDDEDRPGDATRERLFDLWRAAVIDANPGCVPLAMVPPSELAAELDDFIDAAGAHTGGVEEIRDFIATATGEAGGEDVVCRPEIVGGGLELTLFTRSGRYLDHLTVPPERLPVPAEDMLKLVGSMVTLVTNRPHPS